MLWLNQLRKRADHSELIPRLFAEWMHRHTPVATVLKLLRVMLVGPP
jgi:hypothetical protein